ncbi:MAG: UDP-N-acetylmuramoyl-L-alanyl-D-glutamate--2,6-diaminopimelate ligase [Gammaproteobacteria bacterium]
MNAAFRPACSTTLSALAAALGARAPAIELAVRGLAVDSRCVLAGDVFCALPGMKTDGTSYVRDAITRGAVAVIADENAALTEIDVPVVRVSSLRERFGHAAAWVYGNPSESLDVVAVTGTNGKTTVSHLCAQMLNSVGRHCGYIGTLGAGALDGLESTGMTTPDALDLQRLMAGMLSRGMRTVALEASSHALAQSRLTGTRVRTAVFTGLGHDHLDYHANTRDYFEAKKRLFLHPGLACAVLNADDPWAKAVEAALPPDVSLISFSLGDSLLRIAGERTLHLVDVSYALDGTEFSVRIDGETHEVRTRLIGDINVQNLLAALGVMLTMGVSGDDAIRAVSEVTPVTGRLERFGGDRHPLVFVDYAHSPDSLERVLSLLCKLKRGRLTCVFGCGGDRDRSKRPLMGRIAACYADTVIVTSDNPRSERPAEIAREVIGDTDTSRFIVIHDRDEAICTALDSASPDDIVLVAGKGHETVQEVHGVCTPQNDQRTVLAWLERHE